MSSLFIRIGDFAKVKGGKRLPKGAGLYSEKTEHPYIRVKDMLEDGLASQQVKYISKETHSEVKRYTISSNDLYISIAGTIGRVGIVPPELNLANLTENAAKITEIDDTFNPRFLMYFLNSNRGQSQIAAMTGGTSQPKLALNRIKEIKCPRLPLATQDNIVNCINNYDSLIANNRRRIALLEKSARQLYKEWFVRFRFPGHENVKIVDGVPEGWDIVQVGDLLTLQRGFDLPLKKRESGSIPIYASTGINGYHNEPKVQGPGIITGRSGSLGKVMYVADNFWPLNTTLWIKEFKRVTPLYALFFLRELKLENYNGGAAVPTLNRNDVHRCATFAPPESLLQEFSDFTKPLFLQIDKLAKQSKELTNARDLLLPKLMSGELAV